MNAKQSYLTGCALIHRKNSLVVVEGGPKGIKRYKNLMLNRIKWNEDSQILETSETSNNACYLVWEGVVKEPAFKEFTFKQCEMEVDAKLYLQEHGVEYYWKYSKEFITQ